MNAADIVRLLDMVVSLAVKAGISLTRYQSMKDASGGALTDEQVDELVAESRQAVEDI